MTRTVLNIQAEASTDAIRTETYQGREYLVVPVIALVEGVLHSANAADPELALASEYGRYPTAWDGRPVVMNHPMVNGSFVSANSPSVLEDWCIGMLFNTHLDGTKLKTEAWIDLDKVNTLGGEAASTVERIQNGEMVEVSTGLFASVEASPGRFNGESYAGVWRAVAPDHLAFLSEGTIGACSIADGCGVPRLNMFMRVKPQQHDCDCGCGGTCKGDSEMPEALSEEAIELFADLGVNTVSDIEPELAVQATMRSNKVAQLLSRPLVHSLPADMPFENANKLVRNALMALEGCSYAWIYTMTSTHVVYETWDSPDLVQRSYTISEDGSTVTLGDDEQKVNLLTKIVPVANEAAAMDDDAEDEDEDEDDSETKQSRSNSNSEDQTMSQAPNGNGDVTQTQAGDVANSTQTPATPAEPTANAAPSQAPAPKVLTAAEYIAQAPAEVREVLSESMRLHNDRKNKLISDLKSNERCDYSEDELRTMSMTDLERMSKLANIPTYEGAIGVRQNSQADLRDNAVPTPPKVFESATPASKVN